MLPRLRDELLWQHIDFDYGDEELLSRHGKAQRKGGKPVLRMAKAEYRAVLVPPLRTMRRATLDLLERFAKLGGKVVFAGDPPKHVDCRPSDDAINFASQCVRTPAQGREMADAVAAECRRVAIVDEKDAAIEAALYQLREDVDAFYLFICNTGMTAEQLRQNSLVNPPVAELKAEFPTVRVRGFAECDGAPQEWDALDGKRYAAVVRRLESGQWEIQTSLPRLGSRLFVIPKRPTDGSAASRQWDAQTSQPRLGSRLPVAPKKPVVESLPSRPVLKEVRRDALNPPLWPVALSEANVLVLDRPAYRVGDGAWQAETEILRVDDAVRESLGIARRGGQMVQPWARARNPNPKSVPVELRYAFNVAVVPSGDLCFAVERPERFRVAVNGIPIKTDNDCGWWTDLSLRRLPVDPALLKVGRNEIALTCNYDEDHGFEAAYLLGGFGVELEGLDATLIPPVTELSTGDWVAQGLPFYAGNVSYLAQVQPTLSAGERLFVQIPEYDGVAVQVWVNGQSAGVIAWPPNEVNITDLARGE
ncbi:MAG: hypothetical protein FJ272_21610, partial [Planctomycetes bacterium]|nr:hypothetical protein [Planctomycetota bacterium]